jgi:hypothetical protein
MKRKAKKLKAIVEQQHPRLLLIDELPSNRSPDEADNYKDKMTYRVSFLKQTSPSNKSSVALTRRLVKEDKEATSTEFNESK